MDSSSFTAQRTLVTVLSLGGLSFSIASKLYEVLAFLEAVCIPDKVLLNAVFIAPVELR